MFHLPKTITPNEIAIYAGTMPFLTFAAGFFMNSIRKRIETRNIWREHSRESILKAHQTLMGLRSLITRVVCRQYDAGILMDFYTRKWELSGKEWSESDQYLKEGDRWAAVYYDQTDYIELLKVLNETCGTLYAHYLFNPKVVEKINNLAVIKDLHIATYLKPLKRANKKNLKAALDGARDAMTRDVQKNYVQPITELLDELKLTIIFTAPDMQVEDQIELDAKAKRHQSKQK